MLVVPPISFVGSTRLRVVAPHRHARLGSLKSLIFFGSRGYSEFLVGGAASGPLAGLFYGLGVRLGDRYDSFSEIPRDELEGEES